MTYYILIAFCLVILVSYFFDITSKHTKIPGVFLLILTGMAIKSVVDFYNVNIPQINMLLPVIGTLGLVLIVLEAGLDLTLTRAKGNLIIKSMSSAVFLALAFAGLFACFSFYFLGYDIKTSLVNIIPIAIISSAVAIPSAISLPESDREFVTYESSVSDIFGILIFNFVVYSHGLFVSGFATFIMEIIVTLIMSVVFSIVLAVVLHKINHHVKYILIITVIVLIYALAKLFHLPSLLVVLIFGLVMNNNNLLKNRYSMQIINFEDFNTELYAFKNITAEMTFIVRSFFFMLFGFYTGLADLLSLRNLITALMITAVIFILRALYFKIVLRLPLNPLFFFAPRGLITILLFLSIPHSMLLPMMSVGFVTQVIFITILIMTVGNKLFQKAEILVKPLS